MGVLFSLSVLTQADVVLVVLGGNYTGQRDGNGERRIGTDGRGCFAALGYRGHVCASIDFVLDLQ